MPLYEYECTACHERTEKIQKFSDPEITICPHCSGHLERVLSAPAIAFKGGGWYADGYGNAKPKSSESNGDSKSESKSESKNDSKGDSKSDSKSGNASSSDAGSNGAASTKTSSEKSTPAASPAPAASSSSNK